MYKKLNTIDNDNQISQVKSDIQNIKM